MYRRRMGRYWVWAVLVGAIFHLFSFGGFFTHLVSALLTLTLLGGGFALMLFRERAVRPLGYAVLGVAALLVLPSALAESIRGIWTWDPILLVLKILIGVAIVAGIVAALRTAFVLRRRLRSRKSSTPLPPGRVRLGGEPVRRPRGVRSRDRERLGA